MDKIAHEIDARLQSLNWRTVALKRLVLLRPTSSQELPQGTQREGAKQAIAVGAGRDSTGTIAPQRSMPQVIGSRAGHLGDPS
jgi:hypothetical protein